MFVSMLFDTSGLALAAEGGQKAKPEPIVEDEADRHEQRAAGRTHSTHR